jgi:precorrin-6B methylase 1
MNTYQVNERLLSLWERQVPANTFRRLPALYGQVAEAGIVFVGLNPSFSIEGWKQVLSQVDACQIERLFEYPSLKKNIDLEKILEYEERAHCSYPFFAQHSALAERLKLKWNHFDIFACRERDQARVRACVVASENGWELTGFGNAQFEIFESLLALARPRLVVVVNALAAHIYKHRRNIHFDTDTGAYADCTAEAQFPVLLSGMLTGARALDIYSRERLFWHAERLLSEK